MMEEEEIEIRPADDGRMVVLVIYDIVDNKRRNGIVKCLSQYAIRVQKSCFEGFLSMRQCEEMERRAVKFVDEARDSFRIYILRDSAFVRSYGRGDVKEDDVIVY